jgi:hypothetical protein
MKTPLKCVGLLLPFMVTACFHKTQQAQNQPLPPALIDTPLPTPPSPPTELPPRVDTTPKTQPVQATAPPPKPQEKPAKHPPKHSKPDPRTPEQTTVAAATPPAPTEVSAIGQLTAGNPSDSRYETEQVITSTERGLKDITRALTDPEQKTAGQIREFLKQARIALSAGDLDGAHTLAQKAKVLLTEIAQ